MELPTSPTILISLPVEIAADVAEALGLLARRRWLDGDPVEPRLTRLRGEMEAHGRRWAAMEQDVTTLELEEKRSAQACDQDFSRHPYG